MSNLSGLIKRFRDIMRMDPGISGDAQRIEQISWLLFLKIYDSRESDWEFVEDDYKSIIPEEFRWKNWAKSEKTSTNKPPTGDKLLRFVNEELFPALKKLPVDANTPVKKSIVRTVFEETNQYMKDGVQLRKLIDDIDAIDFNNPEDSHAFGEIYEIFLKELQSAGSAGEFYTPRAVTDFIAEKINPTLGEVCADLACGTGGFLTSWLKVLGTKTDKSTEKDRQDFENSVYGVEKKQFPYTLCVTNILLQEIDNPKIFHENSLERKILDITDDEKFDVIMMNPPYGGSEKEGIVNGFPKDIRSSETADLFMNVIMYSLKENGRAAVVLPDGFLFETSGAKFNIKSKLLKDFNLHTVIRLPGSVFAPYTSITTNILFFDKTGETKETWFYRLDMPEGYKNFSKTKPMMREHFKPVDEWWGNRVEIQDDKGAWKSKKYSASEIFAKGCSLDLCGFPTDVKIILSPEDTMQNFITRRNELDRIIDDKIDEIRALLEVRR